MAIRFRIINTANNSTLAERDIPDTALPKIQAVFPGTATQTANQVLDYLLPILRNFCRNSVLKVRQDTDQTTVDSGQITEQGTFDAAYPP